MKYFTWIICTIFLGCNIYGQGASDEKKLRSVIKKMEVAWNAHDYFYSGKNDVFDPDAVLINPVGMYWKNRAEIINGTQTFGAMRLMYETSKNDRVDIRFIAPAVAFVIIKSTSLVTEDYNMPNGAKGGTKGETHENVSGLTFVKKNNVWKITSEQITSVDANAAHLNPVK